MWLTLLLNILLPALVQFLQALFAKSGAQANFAPSKPEFLARVEKKFWLGRRRIEVAGALYDQAVAVHTDWKKSPFIMESADAGAGQFAVDLVSAAKGRLKIS